MPNIHRLSVWSRVRNIYTSQGLVNGALGTVKHIEFPNYVNSEEPNIPSIIYILFDDPSTGLIFQVLHITILIQLRDVIKNVLFMDVLLLKDSFQYV